MCLISQAFRQWDDDAANANDTAKQGIDLEFALYMKQTHIEQAVFRGDAWLQVLFGYPKYFDSIRPHIVRQDLSEADFPKREGALAWQGHQMLR